MSFNPKALLVTAAYLVFLGLAIGTNSVTTWDFVERLILWAVIALLTIATVTSMIRHRRFEPFGQDAALREIGRWLHAIVNHV